MVSQICRLIHAGRRSFTLSQSSLARSSLAPVCAITSILVCAIAGTASAQQPQPLQSVGTVYAERKPIAKTLDFVGRIEARERVIVQARVKGYLEAVLFKEGDFVK